MIGSAKLILKTMTNGVRKNSNSHIYGMATMKYLHKFSLKELFVFTSRPDTNHPITSGFHRPKSGRLRLPILLTAQLGLCSVYSLE